MRLFILLVPFALCSAPLFAEPGLPDETLVLAALGNHPSVVAARTKLDAARADARARAKGSHEIIFSSSYLRRSVDTEGSFDEYDAQLSRAFRLPGKAKLDRDIGAYGIEAAENLAEDAKHKAALTLASHWWDWLGATAEAKIDAQAVENYEKALAAVKRRVQLRDASQLEADQTAAALGGARVLAETSTGRANAARARLAAHFPALALPVQPIEVPQPRLPEAGLDRYRDLVIANSHEIAAADAIAHRMGSLAARARKDKMADPSLGVRVLSERNGAERGAGLTLSIPLGGGYRSAIADQATLDASAAQAEASLARMDVQETADAGLAEAKYRYAAWQRAREGLDAQMAALLKLRRGHDLGETDLSDLLLGERMVHDAFRGEAIARTEAMRAITKLRIDSHELWISE